MKSDISDYLGLLTRIYYDACSGCAADVSDIRDLDYIEYRTQREGLSFLTITLPDFCRDFERSLAESQIDSKYFRSFRKYRSIPSFLRGMISRLFDVETGELLHDKTNTASSDISMLVACVRQICLAFKKIEVACSPKREQAALDSFISTEQSFEMFTLPREDTEYFISVSFMLWSRMLRNIRISEAIPRHGPGATAERITGNQKYRWQFWHNRLEPYFPILENGYSLSAFESAEVEAVTFLDPDEELPVRVCPVPKTLKGPRIIAIEPACMQYVQQGIRDILYDVIESSEMTAGHINFRDQSINQSLAMESSITGRLATIDLSDASDRVPLELALQMFASNPDLKDAVEACRSRYAEMPNGSIVGPLRKFASMGSALCFPVEAMYFYTICVMALLREHKLSVTYENCFTVSRYVHVYGDDILVPSTNAATVLDYLQKYNCKVNLNKTFVSGSFRESCGMDAYAGGDVTPLYVRKRIPKNRRQASELISWVSLGNSFYKRGYWETARFIFDKIERILGVLPVISWDSQALGRHSYLGALSIGKWNRDFQSFEVKAWMPEPVHRTDDLDGYGALSKSLLNLAMLKNWHVSRDALHLEHSALHGVVALKHRWVPSSHGWVGG